MTSPSNERYILSNFNELCLSGEMQNTHIKRGESAATNTPSAYFPLGELINTKLDDPKQKIGAYLMLGIMLEQQDSDGGTLEFTPAEFQSNDSAVSDSIPFHLANGLSEQQLGATEHKDVAEYKLLYLAGIILAKQCLTYTPPEEATVISFPFKPNALGLPNKPNIFEESGRNN